MRHRVLPAPQALGHGAGCRQRWFARRALLPWGICLTLTGVGCLPPSGTGKRARSAFTTVAPVVTALEQFRARAGRYPDSLAELTPRELAVGDLAAIDRALGHLAPRGQRRPLEPPFLRYRREEAEFSLTLAYRGPGAALNVCRYASAERIWRCEAYFSHGRVGPVRPNYALQQTRARLGVVGLCPSIG